MKLKSLLPLFILTVIAAIFRFTGLSHLPVSPNWDEVSHGYNAYSVLMTGKDEWGKTFPLIFRAFGDYKLPLYIYLTIFPVWLFGLNVFAIRFISALAGTLAIPGIYFLTKELFPEKEINLGKVSVPFAYCSAFLLTFLPWHFFISRPALEANLSLTLIIFGFYFLIKFFNSLVIFAKAGIHKSSTSLLPSVILLGLSLHTYNTARVFVPLLVLVSLLIFKPKIKFNIKNIFAIFLAVFFSGMVIFQVYLGEGTARYEKLKILSPAAVFQIGEKRAQSKLPPLLTKVVYNRPVFFVTTVAKNYFSYFSPDFFTQKWGAQFQFAIPNTNLLTFPVFLIAFLGFFAYIPSLRGGNPTRQSQSTNSFRLLYSWLLLSPVAASLTIDPAQALRPNPMIPAIVLFAVLGLSRLLVIIPANRKFPVVAGIGVWILFLFAVFVKNYTVDYAKTYSASWQYGYRQVMAYVKEHESEYDRIFITKRYGEPHIFYAFFTGLAPEKLQPGPENIRYFKSDWYWTDKVGKVYFINDWQIPVTPVNSLPLESGGEVPTQRSLLVTSPDHIPVNAHVIQTVSFLDGSTAYIITSVP